MNDPLQPGVQFSTPYESGCIVLTAPITEGPLRGSFTALDSDGVECSYHVCMVGTIDTDSAGNYGPIPYSQA